MTNTKTVSKPSDRYGIEVPSGRYGSKTRFYEGMTARLDVSIQSGGKETPQEYFPIQLSLNSEPAAGQKRKPIARMGFLHVRSEVSVLLRL
jgi:hypothetical protein